MHMGMEASILDKARSALAKAKKLLDDEEAAIRASDNVRRRAMPTTRRRKLPGKRCAICREVIQSSVWYCVECEGRDTTLISNVVVTSQLIDPRASVLVQPMRY